MTSRFDGLSLPELMDLMHEIVEPEPVSWLPQTEGWWILFGWLTTVVVVAAWHWRQRRRRNGYRRAAEAELDAIVTRVDSTPDRAAGEIAALLKRTALSAYPRDAVASLTGREWIAFLCASTNNDPQITDSADALVQAAYRPGVDARKLVPIARRWIRTHRV